MFKHLKTLLIPFVPRSSSPLCKVWTAHRWPWCCWGSTPQSTRSSCFEHSTSARPPGGFWEPVAQDDTVFTPFMLLKLSCTSNFFLLCTPPQQQQTSKPRSLAVWPLAPLSLTCGPGTTPQRSSNVHDGDLLRTSCFWHRTFVAWVP